MGEDRHEIDAFGFVLFVLIGGFLIGAAISVPLEVLGRHECRKNLEAANIPEPKDWPNCRNLEGQRIMKQRHPRAWEPDQ